MFGSAGPSLLHGLSTAVVCGATLLCGAWAPHGGASLLVDRLEGRGLSTAVGHGPLTEVASLLVAHRLEGPRASVVVGHRLSTCRLQALERGLSSCGTWSELH